MKVKEWLESKGKNEQATFIIERAVKDDATPFYHDEYRTTPIRSVYEWLDSTTAEKYIVINADHAPIDVSNGGWTNWYKGGHLHCAVITTEEELYKHYSETQAKEMIEWYDKKVREQMQNK